MRMSMILMMGTLLMSNALAQELKNTGASLAWTSDDPVIRKAIALLDEGKFNEAQSMLAGDDGHPDSQVMRARDWKLIDHLKSVVAEGESTDKSEVSPLRHRVEYSITIPAKTAGVRTGSLARIWLPYPQEYRQQKDVKLISASLNGQSYDA